MDRSLLLGIIGGLSVFIIICSFILLQQPDFDQQLIVQVNRGVPVEKLILQIDEDAFYMQVSAKKRLDSRIMDSRYWGNGDLEDPHNFRAYVDQYEADIGAIRGYKNIRVMFVKREITEGEFLQQASSYKSYIESYNLNS